MITAKRISALSKKRPRIVCRDFMPMVEGSVAMMFAGGGVGKSFAAIRAAMHYVRETKRSAALWLTEDCEGENYERYERLLCEFEATPRKVFDDRITFITNGPVRLTELRDGNAVTTQGLDEIRMKLLEFGLVVIDPLLQFQGCDENNNTHAGVFMGMMKQWAEEETKTILLLHHRAKVLDMDYPTARGASEWINGTRVAYLLSRDKNDDDMDYRHLKLVKDNNNVTPIFCGYDNDERQVRVKIFPKPKRWAEDKGPNYVTVSLSETGLKGPYQCDSIPFDMLHKYIKQFSYSPFSFSDGVPSAESNTGHSGMIVFEVFEQMTTKEAEEMFSQFRALIVTTKHHFVEGKFGWFRVFVKLDSPMSLTADEHKEFCDTVTAGMGGHVDEDTNGYDKVYPKAGDEIVHFYMNGKEFNWRENYQKLKIEKVRSILEEKLRGPEYGQDFQSEYYEFGPEP